MKTWIALAVALVAGVAGAASADEKPRVPDIADVKALAMAVPRDKWPDQKNGWNGPEADTANKWAAATFVGKTIRFTGNASFIQVDGESGGLRLGLSTKFVNLPGRTYGGDIIVIVPPAARPMLEHEREGSDGAEVTIFATIETIDVTAAPADASLKTASVVGFHIRGKDAIVERVIHAKPKAK